MHDQSNRRCSSGQEQNELNRRLECLEHWTWGYRSRPRAQQVVVQGMKHRSLYQNLKLDQTLESNGGKIAVLTLEDALLDG